MAEITVSNLIKSFEVGSNVLDGLSFTVNSGERVGILGPNGCGKTALFRILTGALDYDEGQISITPGERIGLISQIPVFPEGWRTEDVLLSAQARLIRMSERITGGWAATPWTASATGWQTDCRSPRPSGNSSSTVSPAGRRPG